MSRRTRTKTRSESRPHSVVVASHYPRPRDAESPDMAKRIGTILIDLGFLDEEGLMEALEEQKGLRARNSSARWPSASGRSPRTRSLRALGEQYGMKVVRLADLSIPPEATELVNETMAQAFKVVPIAVARKDKSITVAMAEPQNPATLGQPQVVPRGRGPWGRRLREGRFWRRSSGSMPASRSRSRTSSSRSRPTRGSTSSPTAARTRSTWRPSSEMAEAAPVRKLLNMVLLLAIKDKASDIHFEPFEDEYKMRYRVDGRALRARPAPPPPRPRPSPAVSRSCRISTSPSAGCRRTAGSS